MYCATFALLVAHGFEHSHRAGRGWTTMFFGGSRVSKKNQKSKFWYATYPSGKMSHQKKFSIIDPYKGLWHPFIVLHCNYNEEIGKKFDFVISFDWRVLLT